MLPEHGGEEILAIAGEQYAKEMTRREDHITIMDRNTVRKAEVVMLDNIRSIRTGDTTGISLEEWEKSST